MVSFLLVLQIVVALLLIIVVMIQKPASEGLGFGGNQSPIISAKTASDLFTKTTIFLATAFMINSLLLAVVMDKKYHKSIITESVEKSDNLKEIEKENKPVNIKE